MSETKLDESFFTAQFALEGYEIRCRKNKDKCGGGLIKFVKNGFICRTIPENTSDNIECICSEFQKVSGFVSVYIGHPHLVT